MDYYKEMLIKSKDILKKDDIKILGIETSCDETAASIVSNGRNILSHEIASQIDLHKEYGGVVPEIASRVHVDVISQLIDETIHKSGLDKSDIDAIAVTYGPGLVGSLLVGVSMAKALAYGLKVPLIGVNHIEGHISANYIEHEDLKPPFLCLVVSGGHSHILHIEDYGQYKLIGRTMDDAVGEAYDKVARTLGLEYPGGPIIDRLSKEGDPHFYDFPRPNIRDQNYNFSFSGLKTAVINHLNSLRQKGEDFKLEDVAASFQEAVVDVLVDKTMRAMAELKEDKLALAGGVASNSGLRARLDDECKKRGIRLYYPSPLLCTDNGAMIASAAYFKLLRGEISDLSLNAVPRLSIS